jgi:hypothetical protein
MTIMNLVRASNVACLHSPQVGFVGGGGGGGEGVKAQVQVAQRCRCIRAFMFEVAVGDTYGSAGEKADCIRLTDCLPDVDCGAMAVTIGEVDVRTNCRASLDQLCFCTNRHLDSNLSDSSVNSSFCKRRDGRTSTTADPKGRVAGEHSLEPSSRLHAMKQRVPVRLAHEKRCTAGCDHAPPGHSGHADR